MSFLAVALVVAGCAKKLTSKPCLAEQYRGEPDEPEPTLPGILTGKRGEYAIYER